MDTKQPRALTLAAELRAGNWTPNVLQNETALRGRAADELQILHAENESLRTTCDNLRAGYNAARLEITSLRERVQMLGQLARDVNSRRVLELEAQLEAVGAGGVGRLVPDVSLISEGDMPPAPAQQVTAPDGWQLVPVEPTKEMKVAAVKFANGSAVYKAVATAALEIEEGIYGEAYEAMLAAAPQPAAQALDAREKLHLDVARAIWEVMREYEDRCDLELEDIGCSHVVWQLANAAIAAQQGATPMTNTASLALQTIAEFPVTKSPKNMDAANMRAIAQQALAAIAAQQGGANAYQA